MFMLSVKTRSLRYGLNQFSTTKKEIILKFYSSTELDILKKQKMML